MISLSHIYKISQNYDLQTWNYDFKSLKYDILNWNYDFKSHNYDLSHSWDLPPVS